MEKKKSKIILCTSQDGAGRLFMSKMDHPIFETMLGFGLHEAVPVREHWS